jgi:hypothetical protein
MTYQERFTDITGKPIFLGQYMTDTVNRLFRVVWDKYFVYALFNVHSGMIEKLNDKNAGYYAISPKPFIPYERTN